MFVEVEAYSSNSINQSHAFSFIYATIWIETHLITTGTVNFMGVIIMESVVSTSLAAINTLIRFTSTQLSN